jgi:hypothetical protein
MKRQSWYSGAAEVMRVREAGVSVTSWHALLNGKRQCSAEGRRRRE